MGQKTCKRLQVERYVDDLTVDYDFVMKNLSFGGLKVVPNTFTKINLARLIFIKFSQNFHTVFTLTFNKNIKNSKNLNQPFNQKNYTDYIAV